MVPIQQHTHLKEELRLAEQKIGSLQGDLADMTSVIDQVNFDKKNQSKSVKDFKDQYLLVIKSLKNELAAVKTMAQG